MVYERNSPGEVAGCTIGRRDVLNVGWTYCWRDGARERPLQWAVNNVDGLATGWFLFRARYMAGHSWLPLDERVYPGRIIPRLHRVPLPHWVRHAYRTLHRYLLRVHVLDPPSEGLCRSIGRRLDNPSVNWRIRLRDRYPGSFDAGP